MVPFRREEPQIHLAHAAPAAPTDPPEPWLSQIKRINRKTLSNRELADLNELARLRNRIVHMTYQSDPDKHQWLFDANEAVKAATLARGYARHYVDFLLTEYERFGLPIRPGTTPAKS